MTTLQLFATAWDWHPSVVVGCFGLMAAYLVAARPHAPRRVAWYTAGVLTILFALVSPLDPLGDDYLFSAHMIQHLLLALVAPPLLLLGIPDSLVRRWLVHPVLARIERQLSRPQERPGFNPLKLKWLRTPYLSSSSVIRSKHQ